MVGPLLEPKWLDAMQFWYAVAFVMWAVSGTKALAEEAGSERGVFYAYQKRGCSHCLLAIYAFYCLMNV
jgi:hypothetical protein